MKTPFVYSDKELNHLYNRHKRHGHCDGEDFVSFRARIIEAIEPPSHLLFSILPKAPELMHVFYNHLTDDEFDLISGLANLVGFAPQEFPITLNPNISADILLIREGGKTRLESFGYDTANLNDLAQDVARYFWKNFQLEELERLSGTEQLLLIRSLKHLPELSRDNPEQHKKLVFGLHIPREIKEYHRQCIRELSRRILTSPVYAGVLESFLEPELCEKSHIPHLKEEKDKRYFVKFIMSELAQIWNIPTAIEEDFKQTHAPDQQGKPFAAAMHAYYRTLPKADHPAGLVIGINTEWGYLNGQSYTDLKGLAHEFGHHVSMFITDASTNHHLSTREQRIQSSPLLTMPDLVPIFQANSPISRHHRYYQQISTDFSGLPKPQNKSYYKGQLEERHADWLGEEIAKAIENALLARRSIRNFERFRSEYKSQLSSILRDLDMDEKDENAKDYIYEAIARPASFEQFEPTAKEITHFLQSWCARHIDPHKEHQRISNIGGKDAHSPTSKTIARASIDVSAEIIAQSSAASHIGGTTQTTKPSYNFLTPPLLAQRKLSALDKRTQVFFQHYHLYTESIAQTKNTIPQTSSLPLHENDLSHRP